MIIYYSEYKYACLLFVYICIAIYVFMEEAIVTKGLLS